MRVRLGIALLALAGLTAFAPAPFPKSSRRAASDEISLATFQGTWRVTGMQTVRSDGNHQPYSWSVTHIRITEGKWEFMTNNQPGGSFPIAVDGTKRPAHLNFLNRPAGAGAQVTGVAIMRRQGSKVQVMYTWGGEAARPKSFENPPNGPWLVTLER